MKNFKRFLNYLNQTHKRYGIKKPPPLGRGITNQFSNHSIKVYHKLFNLRDMRTKWILIRTA